MSQNITIRLYRSDAWLKAQAQELACNVDASADVNVPLSDVPPDVRAAIVSCDGKYPAELTSHKDGIFRLDKFTGDITPTLAIEALSKTVRDVETRIARQQQEKKERALNRRREREARERDAEERRQMMKTARELLASELKERDELKQSVATLETLLVNVDRKALDDAVYKMAADRTTKAESAIRDEIEGICTRWIFPDNDDLRI